MNSDVDICNTALNFLGITTPEIQNLVLDRSKEGSVCRRFYSSLLLKLLRDFSWPWATKYVNLALVEEDPNTAWRFSYRYPADCMFFRRIWNGMETETIKNRIDFIEGSDSNGPLIFTNKPDALGVYTRKNIDVMHMPHDFKWAFAETLAVAMAPGLIGQNSKAFSNLIALANFHMGQAIARGANEISAPVEMLNDILNARTGAGIAFDQGRGWFAEPESFTP